MGDEFKFHLVGWIWFGLLLLMVALMLGSYEPLWRRLVTAKYGEEWGKRNSKPI